MTTDRFNMCSDETVVLLCSSGMDSLLLLNIALTYGNIVFPLFVHSEFPWEDEEYAHLEQNLASFDVPNLMPLTRIDLSGRNLYSNTWSFSNIPQWENGIDTNTIKGRVNLLVTVGYIFATTHGINNVIIGITSHLYYPDNKLLFLDKLQEVLNMGLSTKISLHFPLPSASVELIRNFVANNRQINWNSTFSCYSPKIGIQCNNCYKCTEKRDKLKKWNCLAE